MSQTATKTGLQTFANRTSARLAGALIIIGYLTYGLPDGLLIQPLLGASDPLASVAENTTQLTVAALIMAINSAAVVGISLFIYPTIRQHSETVALTYIGTRIFESILMMVGIVCLLLLVPLSQEYVQASAGEAASLQAVGTLAVQGNFFAYSLAMSGLAVGSIPLCHLLYQTRLVPRWISVAGLVGYPVLLVLMVVDVLGNSLGSMLYALYIPGMIFELGIAVWLIVYGFNTVVSESQDSPTTNPETAN